jgi:sodium-independent sulfate anion transporter 11
MSLEVANVIQHVQEAHPGEWSAPVIATALAFICGFIVLGIGLLRLGWIIEFIPQPAVSGFMTGSAINIAAGQTPGLFGIAKRFNTREATYKVIINTLKNLKYSNLDAALGVTALVTLYAIKWGLAWGGNRYERFRRPAFFMTSFRHAFVIIIWTIIAWRVCVGKAKPPISILGTVPRGLQDIGQPYISPALLSALGPKLPVATIILVLEHIAIAKSFGRLNGYKINPNQELVAIGVNNTLGTLFSAYPSTGSFSRSALKSKSGVRTPAAGIPTGIVVLIAMYALTDAFYWIPNAALSALIIHAVADLVASPKQSYGFWRVSPLEYIIWLAAVLVSIFSSIENGIYTSLAASVVLLLFRIARPRGHFLGRVRIKPEGADEAAPTRDVYVPLCGDGGITNPQVKIESPPPGVVIYRFEESFLYPNASYINQAIIDHVKTKTRRGKDMSKVKLGDRAWNDPGPRRGAHVDHEAESGKPICRAVILDFAAVANLDTTGVQNLIDLRREVEKWADGPVEFHFSAVLAPWTRRALIAGGFGYGNPRHSTPQEVAPTFPPMDSLSPQDRAEREREALEGQHERSGDRIERVEAEAKEAKDADYSGSDSEAGKQSIVSTATSVSEAPLLSTSTPFFHFDLGSAIAAVAPGE